MSVVHTSGCNGAADWKINVFNNQSFYLDLTKVDLANDVKIIFTDHTITVEECILFHIKRWKITFILRDQTILVFVFSLIRTLTYSLNL